MTLQNEKLDCELPAGFRWGSTAAGIKKNGKPDLGIVVAQGPCVAAATFTQNAFCAAPVTVSRQTLSTSRQAIQGVVVNAGCANAGTGEEGLENAKRMAQRAAEQTSSNGKFLVCSTGVIGVQLPMEKVFAGVEKANASLGSSPEDFISFARAILTTDTLEKVACAELKDGQKSGRIVACAKGAGMIAPHMATLLCFVATDVEIDAELLQECFSRTTERSLNCMTVDGDTSTNDTAIVLANGASGLRVERGSEQARLFEEKLLHVMQSIAKQLARDGEGATKLVEIYVSGAQSFEQARTAGLAIGNSNLVKTAIYGRDANWGRIICAVGYSGIPVDPNKVDVRMGPMLLFKQGAPVAFDEDKAVEVLSKDTVRIEVDLGAGDQDATVWTCDLTEQYIEINGSYRT